jgi:hypothetical protein
MPADRRRAYVCRERLIGAPSSAARAQRGLEKHHPRPALSGETLW